MKGAPRRAVAGLLIAAATTAAARGAAETDDHRLELNREADAALARGDAGRALERLELAAAMAHSSDTELLIVRAWLQQGEFRRALGFCAHTVAAHRDSPAAAALYRHLLQASGQSELAGKVPGPADTAAVNVPGPVVTWRSTPAAVPLAGRASALLLDDGRHALTTSRAVADEVSLWVRNGLGETVRAEVVRVDPAARLALLRLESALRPRSALTWLVREPFGGSPGYAIGFEPGAGVPAWPRLHAGFHAPLPSHGARRLGIGLAAGLDATPVYDAGGRLTGLGVRDAADEVRFISAAAMRDWLGPDAGRMAGPVDAPASRIGSDEIYERALTGTLQVLAAAPQ